MRTWRQFIRFAIVGLLSNLVLFLLYLAATRAGVGPKSAMTALYFVGVLMTFVFNRNWSFSHEGVITATLLRYLLVYMLGYALNWTALYLLVGVYGWPHQAVQAAMIMLLALALFLSQKFWVFGDRAAR